MAPVHEHVITTPKPNNTSSLIQLFENKKPRSQRVPNNLPSWALQFLNVEPEPCPLDVFDIGETSDLVTQLMHRRERAQRQGKTKMVQKLDKEIAAAKVEQKKKAKQLSDSFHNSFMGKVVEEGSDDERWDELGSSEPPYRLVMSTVHQGFLELSARREPSQHVEVLRKVDRLGVQVVGEHDTPACGLVVDGCLWRKTSIMSIGFDGWQDVGITPKLTASTFVLLGGQFMKPKDGSKSSFSTAVGEMERSVLISDTRAKQLADELTAAERPVSGLLEYVCEQRLWCTDSDVQPNVSFTEVFDIGDAPETDEIDTQDMTPRDLRF
uniref:Uncharacterized protein n=1 Tax=Noctiluca scintillans TaxID=2966 RepID=A0A7S1ADD0_NOCSC|mmetsp:Transcript_40821/g.108183  ORF Transcript_40821/g.108183 Transcript_40821/m.108183 type:complete len:324 (+) Transcript_40821:86-1057(+)|eukprot:CAMPEP_0194488770 /NCGR_PEP_ID=MMETSP0253-20130528/8568_1 /TAXON_ID=2966 /ORGANISM="Noctiluca scintillans" /LENGTH=323 /DNA_ID=CAMNT_0039329173 /DNA_START=84 /DNA_END=1055 /DNA_ORIENTATION=-